MGPRDEGIMMSGTQALHNGGVMCYSKATAKVGPMGNSRNFHNLQCTQKNTLNRISSAYHWQALFARVGTKFE